MIINGEDLRRASPIHGMWDKKLKLNGVSYGLSEAGYDIRIKDGVTLHPFKRFALASSVERFTMPDDLVAIVHDKSTWARRKLSVFNTVIEPGWNGWLTLELVYHGWRSVTIPAGTGIAQVIFHRISQPSEYTGKYQDQPNMPVKARAS